MKVKKLNTKQYKTLFFLLPALILFFITTKIDGGEQQKTLLTKLEFRKGDEFYVKVVGVSDGDTFTGLTDEKQQVKCRIYGIDAPEKKQAFGSRSKQALSDLVFDKQVKIKIQNKDRYKRAVVWVYAPDGKDVSAEMLKMGLAWHYKQYSKDKEYASLENKARIEKKGLWIDKVTIAPWDFRKQPEKQ
jgi:endonuclease YncB( thermonuclease family)